MRHNIDRGKVVTKCKAMCCQDFVLPFAPEYFDSLNEGNASKEYLKVKSMIEYLGYYDINKDIIKSKFVKSKEYGNAHHYKCKLQDPLTGLCTDYDNRPDMCKRFPNGDPCPYKGCSHN